MDSIKSIFQRKTVNFENLMAYGFSEEADIYSYSTILSDSGFTMTVNITKAGEINTVVIDPAFNEPYTLHLVDGAAGSFVGQVKSEYEAVLEEIAEKCFDFEVFKSKQAKEVIAYIREKYRDEFEYLWQKFPDNAVVRRKDNQKWYAALLTVSRRKLGFDSDENVEILDLRMMPEDIEKQVDGIKILPGYHMNKKHWITICLDSSVAIGDIFTRIEESYRLAVK
ncbi:MAG: MmcQ/YjbR family DNA-binding protein [Bacteroides sp.]|nr:MmcQ/YjbR family DNA-binding protein [Bacteroides sp.]MCM1550253.1 MmcQ/YjbR family DNA-binding protein [Clostridium sp.]